MKTLLLIGCALLGLVYGLEWKKLSDGPWSGREGHMAVSFNGYIYLSGGRKDFGFSNDVWKSANGSSWELCIEKAPWRERGYHTMVVLGDYMYILGGQRFLVFYNDVWRSKDGVNWEQVAEKAPWDERAGLASVSFNGQIYITGGSQGNLFRKFYNDVWSTSDGVNWKLVSPQGQFSGRAGPRLVDFLGEIYLVGGEHGFSANTQYGDVWKSPDGSSWTLVSDQVDWSNRSGHGVVTYDNKMFVLAGYLNLHDLWVSKDAETFVLVDDLVWGCNSQDCGKYDFWSLTHVDESGNVLLVTLGGSGSWSTFGKVYADTWATVLGKQKSLQ